MHDLAIINAETKTLIDKFKLADADTRAELMNEAYTQLNKWRVVWEAYDQILSKKEPS